MTIAALGTSLTARGGWLEALPAALEARLGKSIRIVNFGGVGQNSRWGLGRVDAVVRAAPDIAIIEFAINDAAIHRGVSLAEGARNLTAIVDRLRAAMPEIRLYLMLMNPVRGLQRILRPRLAHHYALYGWLAEHLHIGLIDNGGAWAALSAAALKRALPDGVHPTPEMSVSMTLPQVVEVLARDIGK